jgi:hypothetical protein
MLDDFKDWLKDYIEDEQERNGVAYMLFRASMNKMKIYFLTGAGIGGLVTAILLKWLS